MKLGVDCVDKYEWIYICIVCAGIWQNYRREGVVVVFDDGEKKNN